MIETFLVGVIATASLVAGLFFLKFWRDTHDSFFLAFSYFVRNNRSRSFVRAIEESRADKTETFFDPPHRAADDVA